MNKTLSFFLLSFTLQLTAQPLLYFHKELNHHVNDLEPISNSEVWVAADSGLYHYSQFGNQVTSYFVNPTNAKRIVSLAKSQSHFFAASTTEIFLFNNNQWSIVQGHQFLNIKKIELDASGNLWILDTDDKLFEYDGNNFINHQKAGFDFAINNNTVYLGTWGFAEAGYYYDNGIWQNLPNIPGLGNKVLQMEVNDQGHLYTMGINMINKLQSNQWTVVLDSLIGPSSRFVPYQNDLIIFPGSTLNYEPVIRIGNSITRYKNAFYEFDSRITAAKVANNKVWMGMNNSNFGIINYTAAQWDPEIIVKQQYNEISSNTITAGVSASGELFANPYEYFDLGLFKAEGKTSIFKSNYWFSALEGSGSLIAQTGTYRQFGSNFYSGPKSNQYDSLYLHKYNRVWKVSKAEIEEHKNKYGTPGYAAPEALLYWPGNGNIQNGEARFLAPFNDENFNQLYEPWLGETPDIRGDEAVYFIINDDRGRKSETPGDRFGFEIHGMLYAYDSIQEPALHNSVFLSLNIHNYSNQNYSDLKFGSWNDFDIGNSQDDAIGCDSIANVTYAYNSDANDEGPLGYGSNPPAVITKYLNRSLDGFMYYTNSTGATGNPFTPIEFHNYLNCHWKDGSPLTLENPAGPYVFNGDGYDISSSSPKSKFAFNDQNNWYYSPGVAAESRNLNITNIGTLNAGESFCTDMVYIYARDLNQTNSLGSVALGKTYAQTIQNFYDAQNFDCIGATMSVQESTQLPLTFYPNPSKAGGKVYLQLAPGNHDVALYNLQGKMIATYSINATDITAIQLPSNIETGMYLLHVEGDQDFIGKLMIQ
ncbi:MAG: T9SS type A sorting domain-containing protein [Schleiferiaceae bacterium]|nr:T9SS type A sorting domain-containing protein [Schleiferiaceae bacterium]